MDTLLHDVRYAARSLLRRPTFAAVVVLTLALGVGANSAIFSVVNAVLLRPLPYREPDRLVTVNHFYPSFNGLEARVSAPGFADYRSRVRAFGSVAVQAGWSPNLTGRGDPERLTGASVSGQYFSTLGVPAALGRTLRPDEDQPGRQQVVVLSDALWRRAFGADPRAVGQTLTLNGKSHEIVGVMPPGFRDFFGRTVELWRPLALDPAALTSDARTSEWLTLTARLAPGVTIEQARAELRTLAEQLKQEYPNSYPADWSLSVTSLRDWGTGSIRPALLVLLGAVGFVLLIACANVANLLLARGAARSKEIAVRTALGAGRGQLVRQLLTESVLLALAGGLLGLALAEAGVRALVALTPTALPGEEIGIDGTVLLFTVVVSLGTGLLFGLVPALQASRVDVQGMLKEGGRGAAGDRAGQAVRRALVVAEVALALMLLAGAGLLMKSFARLQGVQPGFDPDNLLTLTLALPQAKYPTDTQQIAFFDQLFPRVAAIPGVQAVGATSAIPFGGSGSTSSFQVEGFQPAPDEPGPWGDFRVVSPDFLRALGAPLLRGRHFTERDGPGAPPVAIVDEELARRYWPNEDAVGKRVTFGAADGEETEWIEIVGVVGHTKHDGLDADARVQLYLPYRQAANSVMTLAVRTTGDPLRMVPLVREAVHAVDKDQPLSQVRTMADLLDASVGQRRLSMLLLTLFAGIALVMACVGIYGMMAYTVAQRTRELGVRMALGARTGDVLALVLRQGMAVTIAGVGAGLLGALALARLIQSQLYGVGATDPATFVAVAVLLAATALLATLIPALRATRVDPVIALRQE